MHVQKDRRKVIPAVLQQAKGGHLIVVQSSTPMIYNLRPNLQQLQAQADLLGLTVVEVDKWEQEKVVLFQVLNQKQQPHQQHYPSEK